MSRRVNPERFQVVTFHQLAQDSFLANWVRRARLKARLSEEGVAVFDKEANRTLFVRDERAALRLREGHKVELLGEAPGIPDRERKAGSFAAFKLGETPPARYANTEKGRLAIDALTDALEGGQELLTPNQIRAELKRRGVNPADLGKREKEQILAGVAVLHAQRGGLDLSAAEEVFLDALTRAKARRDPGTYYSGFLGEIDEQSKAEWAQKGVEYHNKAQFLRDIQAHQANARRRDAPLREGLDKEFKSAGKRDIRDLYDLTKIGVFGEKSVRRLEEAGITLAALRSGQVTEDRLRSLGHIGPEKVETLRKLGFPIAPSTDIKRPVGRPPSRLFGAGRDPFRNPPERLLSGRALVRSPTSGNLEERRVAGRLRQAIQSFKEGWRATIGRPFAYVEQYRNNEVNRAVREAKQLAALKRAASLKMRVEGARSGAGATFWEILFHGQTALRRMVVLGIAVGSLLFMPVGILQFAGWIIFGLAAFLIVGAYLIGLSALNLIFTGASNVLNSLGFLTQHGLQAFLNEIPKVLPTQTGPGILPSYVPVSFNWKLTEVLDPNWFFPDCVNTNTLGAILLQALGSFLHAFGGWVGAHGSFAVGTSIILLLGVPAYFVSRGTSVGFVAVGLFIIVAGGIVEGTSVPVWVMVLLVAGLGTAALLGIGRTTSELGPFALVVGVGLAVALILGAYLLYDSLSRFVDTGGFDWTRSLTLSTQPLAGSLEAALRYLGDGLSWLAGQVTTGWAHVLDPRKLEGIRTALHLGDAPLDPTKCGG